MLADNNYPIAAVDREIELALAKKLEHQSRQQPAEGTTYNLFYRNTMSPGYRADERALRRIVHRNCTPTQNTDRLQLNIYYNNPTTSALLLKNNLSGDTNTLKQTNVVHHYNCTLGDCALLPRSAYIGNTTTSLSRRITMHLQHGGPLTHTEQHHTEHLTRQLLVQNTKILAKARDRRRLVALEAIYIREMDPTINKQINARGTLQLRGGLPMGV